jgi:uncharacterized membrane protein
MRARFRPRWALLAVPAVLLGGAALVYRRRRGGNDEPPTELTGPAELVVMQFPGRLPGRALARRLLQLGRDHQLRVIDAAFLHKDEDGRVETFELLDRAGQREFEALDRAIPEIDEFIAEDDLAAIADRVEPGSTAGAFLIRHTWLDELTSAVERRGGRLVMTEHLAPDQPAPAGRS